MAVTVMVLNPSPAMPSWDPDSNARHQAATVRPKVPWDRYLTFGALMTFFILVFGAVLSFTLPSDRLITVGCLVSFEACLVGGGIRLYLIGRFSRLWVDEDGLTFVSSLGRRRTFPQQSVAQIVRASFDVTVRGSFTLSYYLFIGADGRSEFKLPAKWWPDTGIVGLATTLGIPVRGSFFEVLDGPGFRRKFPRSIRWMVAHPRLAVCLIGVLSLPALVVIVSVVLILQGKA